MLTIEIAGCPVAARCHILGYHDKTVFSGIRGYCTTNPHPGHFNAHDVDIHFDTDEDDRNLDLTEELSSTSGSKVPIIVTAELRDARPLDEDTSRAFVEGLAKAILQRLRSPGHEPLHLHVTLRQFNPPRDTYWPA